MTFYELEGFLMRSGIYRADIVVRHGEIDIIASKRNTAKLKRIIRNIIPASVYWKIIIDNRNWIKNRKKYTYNVSEQWGGE